jgi:hypothetical protein
MTAPTQPRQTTYRLSPGSPPSRHDRHSGRTVLAIGLCAAAVAGIVVTAAFAVAQHDRADASATMHESATGSPPAHQGARHTPAAISQLQTDLTTLGYYHGPVDGVMNVEVEAATMSLQRDAGLRATGVDNPATQAAIAQLLQAVAH